MTPQTLALPPAAHAAADHGTSVRNGLFHGITVGMAVLALYAAGLAASTLGYYAAAEALLSTKAVFIVATATLIMGFVAAPIRRDVRRDAGRAA